MGFTQDGDRVTLSFEMSRNEYYTFLLIVGGCLSYLEGTNRQHAWLLLDFVNRMQKGNPDYQQYFIPENRELPLSHRFPQR